MPSDFPQAFEDAFVEVTNRTSSPPSQKFYGFEAAWNGAAFRFLSAANHSDSFIASVNQHGTSVSGSERFEQERDLFGFFVNGFATLECFAYGLFHLGALTRPTDFPVSTDQELRQISVERTRDKFTAVFSQDQISAYLGVLIADANYDIWKLIRNTLAHRTAPSRTHFWGGASHGQTQWNTSTSLPLDSNTTASYRQWLASSLSTLATSTYAFVTTNL